MPYANPTRYRNQLAIYYPGKYGSAGQKRKRSQSVYTGKTAVPKTVATYGKPVTNATNFGISRRAGLGTRKTVIMPYYTTKTVTMAGGLTQKIFDFGVNCGYDPDLDVGGHQPMMFDEMANIFERYRVIKCNYKIQFSTAREHINCSITVSDASSPSGAVFETVVENGMNQQRFLHANNNNVFTGCIDLVKVDGLTKREYDARHNTLFTQNPGDIIHLFGHLENLGLDNTFVAISIYLEFVVECEGTRVTSQS